MSGRNGERRLRLVRRRIRKVPTRKFRQANRLVSRQCMKTTDHWAPAPIEKHFRLKENKEVER